MLIEFYDTANKFRTIFDTATGFYLRSGVLDENGNETGIDPFMAEFPHLIDVGIMGFCEHGRSGKCAQSGTDCYQSGASVSKPNMLLSDFICIAEQCAGRVNQFALGGRGDPDLHENFGQILKICRENNIVPNYTTSGYRLSDAAIKESKDHCGAVAVSWYHGDYTIDAIKRFVAAGVKTNIHYVLSRNTIKEAIERLGKDDFPTGINAVIFLVYKPVGYGKRENVLDPNDETVAKFFEQIERSHRFKVGVDSCMTPGILTYCKEISFESIDACEGARFSCYIDAQMNMLPCSFTSINHHGISLRNHTIEEAWHHSQFESFRRRFANRCSDCEWQQMCLGGCPIISDIALCGRQESRAMP
ncbi:MAG: SPASM domain-containing protein [Oscillospiraceae bacterium]|nr:SPASM domain-containing protein [Oscillospiraceae bacterium]